MSRAIDVVVKIGGGLLASPGDLADALAAIATEAHRTRILIVPGGGPFADTVRDVDRRIGLSADDAHWMAILAMDQFAYVLASRMTTGALVTRKKELPRVLADAKIPVLAPFRWLRQADPLPHSWDVTSDSIAAWIAGELGAERLLLVKPAEAEDPLVDGYFTRTVASWITPTIVRAGRPLHSALAAW